MRKGGAGALEQVSYNAMLDMVQGMTQIPGSQNVQQSGQSGESDFQKLMEQTQSSQEPRPKPQEKPREDEGAKAERTGEEAGKTPPREEQPVEESPEVQEQMTLAMLAAMQNPVVPVEQVEVPVASEAVAQAPVEQAVEAAVLTDPAQELAGQSVQTVETAPALQPQQAVQTVEQPEQPQQVQPQEQAQPQQQELTQQQGQAETAVTHETAQAETQVSATPEGDADVEVQETAVQEAPVFQQVESAPIKVGESSQTAPAAQPPSVEAQVEQRLTEAIQFGENKVELHLEPANLGKVNVELTVTEEGVLRIILKAENSDTRALLERDVSHLQTILGRDGEQEVRVEVPQTQEGQRTDIHDQEQQEKGQQREREQRQEEQEDSSEGPDFLQQLRLGLVTLD